MEDLEKRIKDLESFLVDNENSSKLKQFLEFGKGFIKNIREGNYSEAGLVMECFKYATLNTKYSDYSKEELDKLGNYIGLTIEVARCLPRGELHKGRMELYED